MTRGGRFLVAGTVLAITSGCAADHHLQVRAIPDPAAKLRFGGGLLSDGRAQLALGNAGTALETFRKLLREQPTNPEAFAGIAACYQAMGRYDLEQANYEFALAYAPHDTSLLRSLASSLERQGQSEEAAKIYAEASLDAAPAKPAADPTDVAPTNVPRLAEVTVALAPAQPTEPKAVATIAVAAENVPAFVQTPMTPLAVTAAALPVSVDAPAAPIAIAEMKVPAQLDHGIVPAALPAARPLAMNATALLPMVDTAAASMPINADVTPSVIPAAIPVVMDAAALPVFVNAAAPRRARQVTPTLSVSAPADAKAEALPAAVALPLTPARPQPADRQPAPEKIIAAEAIEPAQRGPYLERLSTGEVALVTTARPLWTPRPLRVAMAAVQWVPLRHASGRPSIQILNAARSQGLAAYTREALVDRGWRKMAIGDARKVRAQSLVLYSEPHKALAYRLAAQLRCKAAKIAGASKVLVLLGRDAAMRRTPSRRA